MPISSKTPVLPYDPQPEFKQFAFSEKEGWNSHQICIHTHLGTHIDAPWHMISNGKRISDYPIEKFIGQAVLIDVRGQKEIDAGLEGVEAGDILILRTDHTQSAGSPDFFAASPILSPGLAEKIADKKVSLLGIDTYTVDPPPSGIHKYLLSRDILILENLINLDQIETDRFNIFILPLKLDKLDGAPCRVIAQIPDTKKLK
jgi:kynurenine formamidase